MSDNVITLVPHEWTAHVTVQLSFTFPVKGRTKEEALADIEKQFDWYYSQAALDTPDYTVELLERTPTRRVIDLSEYWDAVSE